MSRVMALLLALCALAALTSRPVLAQPYPSRPVRIVVGTTPGGQGDVLARLVGQHLAQVWGQPVVTENRAGADATIAAEIVAMAPADGYTLLLASRSNIVLATALGNKGRYDPVNDFAPIGRIAHVPLVLVVNPAVQATTVPQLIAIARDRPRELTYGSSGSISRLAVELLKASAEIDVLEIPYRGVGPALTDLLAGRIDMMFFDLAIVAPHLKAGTLRLLAPAGRRRTSQAPDLPTLAEQGIRGFPFEPWYGLVAPARTPVDVLAKLRTGLAEIRRRPEMKARLDELGYEPIDDSPQQFSADIAADIEKLSAVIKSAGIKGEP